MSETDSEAFQAAVLSRIGDLVKLDSISSTVDEVLEKRDSCHHVILSSYRVENCLRLCQEYGIVDAASFLLERVGDVGSALMLILSGLNEKFIVLEASIISLVF
ncbi:unnamed protein product, partial [Coffea canephora]